MDAMKIADTLSLLILLSGSASASTCIYTGESDKYADAKTVFIATITGVTDTSNSIALNNGAWHRLNYDFVVRESFNGDPLVVKVLFTNQIFTAYDTDVVTSMPLPKFQPGDNILVFTSAMDEVNLAGCDVSAWHPDSGNLELLRSLKNQETK